MLCLGEDEAGQRSECDCIQSKYVCVCAASYILISHNSTGQSRRMWSLNCRTRDCLPQVQGGREADRSSRFKPYRQCHHGSATSRSSPTLGPSRKSYWTTCPYHISKDCSCTAKLHLTGRRIYQYPLLCGTSLTITTACQLKVRKILADAPGRGIHLSQRQSRCKRANAR